MKITKIVLLAAGAIALLAMIAWFLRDNLIQRISNPLLRDYGISVTDVSLDALASSDATISYLELVHDKGTTIAFEDLTLPIGTTSTGFKSYTARKVSVITATRTDGELFELAELIGQLLALPGNLGNSEVVVAELSLPPYPSVHDLKWLVADGEQKLQATVASVAMSVAITRADATNYAVVFSLPAESAATQENAIAAHLQQHDNSLALTGTSLLNLRAWLPFARLSGFVPPEIEIESGVAALRFDVDIPYDASRSATVTGDLEPSSPLQLTYSDAQGELASIHVGPGSSIEFASTFPDADWSLQQAQASLLVSYDEWQEIPLIVTDLTCKPGPSCSMNTGIAINTAELPVGRVDRLRLDSKQIVVFADEGLRVDVESGATLEMSGFAAADTTIDRIEAQLASDATLELVENGWRLETDSVDANIGAISLSDGVSGTTQLFLENITVSETDKMLSAKSGIYAPASQATVNEQTIGLPGFKGTMSQSDGGMVFALNTVGLHRDGAIELQHNVDTGAGQLSLGGAVASFGARKLSNRVSPWKNEWDLIAGTISVELDANWNQAPSDPEFSAQSSIDVSGLAGYYADTAFTDLSTRLKGEYRSTTGLTTEPSAITIALIEMGIPVENISADYTLDIDAPGVDLENLRMTAFGGVITADPFSFRTETNRNTLTLRAESIDLRELLSVQEFEAIEVSGSIAAALPLTIEGDTVTIVNGTLSGEPPGGVIRYRPGIAADESDVSGIGYVSRILSNFEFTTLTSDVDLTRDGDLNLQLQLTGRNPDLDEKRPVILNLGVENNIPQMLRSLRAARAVEEVLEKRLSK